MEKGIELKVATARMLRNSYLWPNWPFLPLKKAHPSLAIAVVFQDRQGLLFLYEGANMFRFDPPAEPGGPVSPAEIEADGWLVD